MAYRLKSRTSQVPNGFQFAIPEIPWIPQRYQSFNVLVSQVIQTRMANPHLVKKHGWATDLATVENEVDEYNARICAQNGWDKYIMAPVGEPPPPKSRPPSLNDQRQISAAAGRVKKIWSGVKTLNDWIDSKEGPVHQQIANTRALTCSNCPRNQQGDFSRWFTNPASEAIKRQMDRLSDRKLSTPSDEKLNICDVCLCPLKLKVHTPLAYIKAHLTDGVLNELDAVGGCWISSEIRA